MKHVLSASVLLATMAISSSAHTIFQEVYVNGVDQGHINGIRVPTYDGVRPALLSLPKHLLIPACSQSPMLPPTASSATVLRTPSSNPSRRLSLPSPLARRSPRNGITPWLVLTRVTLLILLTPVTRVGLRTRLGVNASSSHPVLHLNSGPVITYL